MIDITQKEFNKKAIQDHYQILDVRRPDEWQTGTICSALTINFMDASHFISEIKKLDKSTSYLIYCRSGNRSKKACTMMDNVGFSKTYNLLGGLSNWKGTLDILKFGQEQD